MQLIIRIKEVLLIIPVYFANKVNDRTHDTQEKIKHEQDEPNDEWLKEMEYQIGLTWVKSRS